MIDYKLGHELLHNFEEFFFLPLKPDMDLKKIPIGAESSSGQ